MNWSRGGAHLLAALALTSVVGTAPVASAAPSTGAGTAVVPYSCGDDPNSTVGNFDVRFEVSVVAPRLVRRHDVVDLDVSMTLLDLGPAHIDVPANGLRLTHTVGVGGTAPGSVEVTGLTNVEAVPADNPIPFTGGVGSLATDRPGFLTFTPGYVVMSNWVGGHTYCLTDSTQVVARTLVL
ncbi:hypothetical protein [Umezawaea sp.]|uniref:hypothetical protein n=1 Tax=Umezawaea sp. TaxID=1955258 RepID=UPI002ED0ABC5